MNGERLDEIARVARGVVHRGHLGGEETGLVLQQRRQQLHGDILRQQRGKDFALVGLVIVDRAFGFRLSGFDRGGDQLQHGGNLRHHRFVTAVNQRHDIDFARLEHAENFLGHRFDECEPWRLDADFVALDIACAMGAAQLIARLAADRDDFHVLAFGDQRGNLFAGRPHDAGVEAAGKATIRSRDHDEVSLVGAGARKKQRRGRSRNAAGKIGDHARHAQRIGTRAFSGSLRAAQLRRRHHLHRLRDLLRGLHASDPCAHFLDGSHGRSVLRRSSW